MQSLKYKLLILRISLHLEMQPPEVFYKKAVIENFAIFTGKHLCLEPLFNRIAGLIDQYLVGFLIFTETSSFLPSTDWRNPTILVYRSEGLQLY